jgi:DNA-nicking Smr family endonuclease
MTPPDQEKPWEKPWEKSWEDYKKSVTPLKKDKSGPIPGPNSSPIPGPNSDDKDVQKKKRTAVAPQAPFVKQQRAAEPPPQNLPHRGGVDGNTERKLRRGKILPEKTIDLHGMTRQEAEATAIQEIKYMLSTKKRCANIITGKGSGALRQTIGSLLEKLQNQGDVRFFCDAPPHRGGSGAFIVYLRKTE